MTESFFIARLFQMCQEGRIIWSPVSTEGFVARVNGVDIKLTGLGETSWINLSISSELKQWSIQEPLPHISEAPIGKIFNWIRRHLGLPPMKGPREDIDVINSEIKTNLILIKSYAIDQVFKRYRGGQSHNEERQELFQQIIYGESLNRR